MQKPSEMLFPRIANLLADSKLQTFNETTALKILIIVSDFISRSYLRELLALHGYSALSARNAIDGLDIFLSEKPDLVLCSVLLPGMSGLEFLNHIRTAGYTTPVIMAATQSSEKIAVQSFRFGANDFLKMPLQDYQIISAIEMEEIKIRNSQKKEKTPEPRQDGPFGQILGTKTVFSFCTCHGAAKKIVERLVDALNPGIFGESEKIEIELGLTELVTNAIEHGNLNITFSEKTKALDTNSLQMLMDSRLADSRYSGRKVTVTYECLKGESRWTIADEGEGFDLSLVPDPTKPGNLEALHGRGIFFSRSLFDSVQYLGKGNQCVATKKHPMFL